MAFELKMPQLGLTMEEGTVSQWIKHEGDEVKTGDTMELSMSDGTAHANGKTYSCTKLPEYMQNILNQGGLIASLNREEE